MGSRRRPSRSVTLRASCHESEPRVDRGSRLSLMSRLARLLPAIGDARGPSAGRAFWDTRRWARATSRSPTRGAARHESVRTKQDGRSWRSRPVHPMELHHLEYRLHRRVRRPPPQPHAPRQRPGAMPSTRCADAGANLERPGIDGARRPDDLVLLRPLPGALHGQPGEVRP